MTMQIIKFFILLTMFAAVVIALQALINDYATRVASRRAVNRRLKLLEKGVPREAVGDLLRPDRANARLGRVGPVAAFYRMAGKAALGIAPQRLLNAMIVTGILITVLLVMLAMALQRPITPGVLVLLSVVGAAIAIGLPLIVISHIAQRRSRKMEEQFPEAIDIFTRALRAGHPIGAAIQLLTQEMSDPMGSEFGIVADEVAYGLDLNHSLQNFAARWDLEDLQMFAVCISVQSETGGNLAEILGNLAAVIRDRASLYLKVRALSSEGRMSAWMLSVLPVLTFVVLFSINPGFYLDVAADPIFAVSFVTLLCLYAIGVIWIRKMVDLKV